MGIVKVEKKESSSKYECMSRDELIAILENETDSKNYGLKWDREKIPEKVVTECENRITILSRKETDDIINESSHSNVLIEGDNYNALNTMLYTHDEKIDLIYIDPPYNTGNQDFIYNDKYVDQEDSWRHSKWLNFMVKRLELARKLLKQEGFIAISIDYNELFQLKLLCDKVFDEKNFLSCISIVNNLKGRSDDNFFATCNEFLLIYARNQSKCIINGISLTDDEIENEYKFQDSLGAYKLTGLRKTGKGWKREDRPYMYYPILLKNNSFSLIEKEEYNKIYNSSSKIFDDEYVERLKNKYEEQGYEFYLPLDSNKVKGRWRWSYDTFNKEKENNVEINSANTVCAKMRITLENGGARLKTNKTTWYKSEYDTGSAGRHLDNILGDKNVFNNPKSVYLLMDIINLKKEKDITVLDFFAGSGTTAEAVMKLNKKDGGNRKFILCTNNENNICEKVTYKRLKNCIKGYNDLKGSNIKGFEEELIYLKTSFIHNTQNRDQMKIELTEKCIPMLCMKSETFKLVKKTDSYHIFTNNKKNKYACIYFDIFGESYKEFISEISNIHELKNLYIFSLDSNVSNNDLKNITNFTEEAIPYKILEVYKRIVRLSKEC